MWIDCRVHIEAKPYPISKKYKYIWVDLVEINSSSTIRSIVEKCNTKDAFILKDLTKEIEALNLRYWTYMFAKAVSFEEIIKNNIDWWLIWKIQTQLAKYKNPSSIRLIIEFF